jgi:uncharacterized membrane protein (UPF0127 family)
MIIAVRDTVLAQTVTVADNFFTRLKGLLGTTGLPKGQALLIRPCNSVHTFGMKYDIDVLFVDKEGQIRKIVASMRHGRVAYCSDSAYVIEMAGGSVAGAGVNVGEYLQIK